MIMHSLDPRTIVISGFPGCGKSTITNTQKIQDYVMIDFDSSSFKDKNDYVEAIIKLINKNDERNRIIFISSHKDVYNKIQEYSNNYSNILFFVAVPEVTKDFKKEWLDRLKKRAGVDIHHKDSLKWIDILEQNYENWIQDVHENISEDQIIIVTEEKKYLSYTTIISKFNEYYGKHYCEK